MEGRSFGDVPLNIELKLEVIDSPNSAGIVIDAVRCAKLALDNGISGALEWPSAYFMKSPPVQHPDDRCRDEVEAFIAANRPAKRSKKEKAAATAKG
jgi:myo-inositol-1-phosphate synthase